MAGSTDTSLTAAFVEAGVPYALAIDINSRILGVAGGAALSTVNAFTKNQSVTPVALVDAATIATDASLSNNFKLTMVTTGRVMGTPSNPTDGMVCNWAINSGVGSLAMTWNASFDFGGAGAPTHSVTASKVDLVSGYYNAATSTWLCTFRKGS